MRDACLTGKVSENPAAILASLLHRHRRAGKRIHDHFVFRTDLEGVGKWYRQLLAESIGKQYNASGTVVVREGITPTVSIGSTDLHSVGQLYFGGPRDKFFRIVSVNPENGEQPIVKSADFDSLGVPISGNTPGGLMDAIILGTQQAMKKQGLPFVSVRLQDTTERTIGKLLQLEMVEVMLLGHLLGVNPYDQPAVENYKRETRQILSEKKLR
jgi:glucose-6-phosphate isomerase